MTPINFEIVSRVIKESGIKDVGRASIREVVRLINIIEAETGIKYIRMEMGVPGLPASGIAVNAEIEALQNGVASVYPVLDGLPLLKQEASRFVKLFLNIDISAQCIIPTTGSMQGSFISAMVTSKRDLKKDTTLFLDPCFPLQKQQHQILGIKYESFDYNEFRGEKLAPKIESYLKNGNISSILYSNPNNPSWMCLCEQELEAIGQLANKYGVVIIEDLAYFGMDFREDYSKPGLPPFQPTVAKYTDNYILLISGSKTFSYAGQRLGLMAISDGLFNSQFPDLKRFFPSDIFGNAAVHGALYAISAGCTHSSQYALAAILKAANDGTYNFVESVREYGQRAELMKKAFVDNGFDIVYSNDNDLELADGFYFTISYKGFTGPQLVSELLYYGISAISLEITGSAYPQGLRACVSMFDKNMYTELNRRLSIFQQNHS